MNSPKNATPTWTTAPRPNHYFKKSRKHTRRWEIAPAARITTWITAPPRPQTTDAQQKTPIVKRTCPGVRTATRTATHGIRALGIVKDPAGRLPRQRGRPSTGIMTSTIASTTATHGNSNSTTDNGKNWRNPCRSTAINTTPAIPSSYDPINLAGFSSTLFSSPSWWMHFSRLPIQEGFRTIMCACSCRITVGRRRRWRSCGSECGGERLESLVRFIRGIKRSCPRWMRLLLQRLWIPLLRGQIRGLDHGFGFIFVINYHTGPLHAEMSRLIDWLVDPSNRSLYGSIDWLIDWLADSSNIHCMVRLIDWLIWFLFRWLHRP